MINETHSPSFVDLTSTERPTKRKSLRARYTRNFFVIMSWSFIVLTVLGFGQDYVMMYMRPDIKAHWFSHFHGGLMSLWLILFLVQSVLARRSNLKLHRQLGLLSVGLGIAMWISMIIVTMRPRIVFPGPEADERNAILLMTLLGIIFFGLFFTWGMLKRKNAPVHKRLLILATIAIMQGSIDRLRFLPNLGTFFTNFIYLDLFLMVPLVAYDLLTLKRVHKITLIGGALIIAGQLVQVVGMGTPTWNKMAFAMFQPFVPPVVEVKLTDAQIASLVGDYGDEKWHATISYKDGKLYYKLPNVPIFEMIATSESETSLTTMAWHLTFVRDKEGQVVKVINKQPDVVWEINRMR